jgi:N-acetylneuraminic acid mutarotase
MLVASAILLLQIGAWSSIVPIPTARQEVGVAAVEGRVYVVGGYDSQGRASTVVEFFDTRSNEWRPGPPVPIPIHHPMVAAVGTKVYVAGGYTEPGGAFQNTYELDTDTLVWTRKADMPTPRGAGAAVAHNGKLYVLGGERSGTTVAEVAVFDPGANAWTELAPMPTPRNHFGSAVIRGRIYAVGGRPSNLAINEAYDPLTNAWTPKASMPTPRSGIAVVAAGNFLHAFGGEGNPASLTGIFPQHEAYNPDIDAWTSLDPMAQPRHGIGAALVGNRIFIPAGSPVQGFGTTAQSDFFAVNEELLLPQFVIGGGYSTSIVLTNPDPVRTAEVTISAVSAAGGPLETNLSQAISVPPLGSRSLTAVDSSTSIKVGTARLQSNVRLSAYALIRGVGPQLTVYPASPARNVIFDVRRIQQGGVSTGVSLLNTSTAAVTVTIGFRDRVSSEEALRIERTLGPGEQLSRFVHELFTGLQNSDFEGTVTLRSTAPLAVAALAFDPTGVVTIPVVAIE